MFNYRILLFTLKSQSK